MSDLALKALFFKIKDDEINHLRNRYNDADIINTLDLMKKNVKEKGRINAPARYLEKMLENSNSGKKENSMPSKDSKPLPPDKKLNMSEPIHFSKNHLSRHSFCEAKADAFVLPQKEHTSRRSMDTFWYITHDEIFKLIDKHGKEFVNNKIKLAEVIADKFKLNDTKRLLELLIEFDSGSNKYGIESLLKSSIEPLQQSIEACTKKYSEECRITVDTNIKLIEDAGYKCIERNREMLLLEIKQSGEDIVQGIKNQIEDCNEKINAEMRFSINTVVCGALIFLLMGLYAGVLMSPLISWLTESFHLGYNIILLSLTTLLPVGVGMSSAKLLGLWNK